MRVMKMAGMAGLPRFWAVLLSALVVLGAVSGVGFAEQLKDVPPDHWAYSSVKMLVDKGYISVYQDGTFQGNKPVDRFTLAAVVARVLNEIASGRVAASAEDIQLLRKLSTEFRQELVSMADQLRAMDNRIKEQDSKLEIMNEDISKVTEDVSKAGKDVSDLKAQAQEMIEDILALKKAMDAARVADRAHEDQLAGLKKACDELAAKDSDLASRITGLDEHLGKVDERVGRVEGDINALGARADKAEGAISALEARAGKLEDRTTALEGRTGTLEGRADALDTRAQELASKQDMQAGDIKGLSSNLGGLKVDLAKVSDRVTSLEQGLQAVNSTSSNLSEGLDSARAAIAGLRSDLEALKADLAQVSEKVDKLEAGAKAAGESFVNERAARIAADSALDAKLGQLTSDFEAYKAATSKNIEALRKENGLLKVLLGVVALLGIAIQ
ncbi:MAG TPA: hypothetical protein GX506_07960 [Firmicutes bacterium]|nr:hypothetical protein [Bacillota bacterium]